MNLLIKIYLIKMTREKFRYLMRRTQIKGRD